MPKKTGIIGGSFNPPHLGHLHAAEAFFRSLGLDRIIVIPAGVPPHKKLAGGVSVSDRLNMTRLAFDGVLEGVLFVSNREIEKSAPSYTVETLEELKKETDDELFLFVGTDMLLSFEQWHRFEDIFPLATLAVMERFDGQTGLAEKCDYLRERYGAKIILIGQKPLEISSTSVRDEIKRTGTSPNVPESVLRYISDRRLYND